MKIHQISLLWCIYVCILVISCNSDFFVVHALHSQSTTSTSSTTPATYRAAVVEHVPLTLHHTIGLNVTREIAQQVLNANGDVYENLIRVAASSKTNIIVFPEDGVYGSTLGSRDDAYVFMEQLPNANTTLSLCTDVGPSVMYPFLQRMACMAQKYEITIVLDMGDVQQCNQQDDPDCPSDGRYQFNTQVAIGDNGALLAKYHKTHLFPGDYEVFNSPPRDKQPEMVTFKSSFGVTFGMFVCFDIYFRLPATQMAQTTSVTDFVFSTYWVNTAQIPPAIATSVQQAFSRANQVNLLASGIGFGYDYSGSGLYSNGTLVSTWYNPNQFEALERLLIADMPRLQLPVEERAKPAHVASITPMVPLRPANPAVEISYHIPPKNEFHAMPKLGGTTKIFTAGPGTKHALHAAYNNVTCNAIVEVAPHQPSPFNATYALRAYSGELTGLTHTLDASFCALYYCPSESPQAPPDCDKFSFEAPTLFSHITMSSNFDTSALGEDYVVVPFTTGAQGQAIPRDTTSHPTPNNLTLTDFFPTAVNSLVLWGQHACTPSQAPNFSDCFPGPQV
jgi:predicted amidohydrolase